MNLSSAIKLYKKEKRIPLIAEIKVYSPKDGDLIKNRDPVEILHKYEEGGACAISVVTEVKHFKGNLKLLNLIRKNTDLPILRKDFIQNKKQIEETKKIGVEAVLLITSMLSCKKLFELNNYAHKLGLETLVEIHNQKDLEKIRDLELDIIGINNKDILKLERDKDQINPTLELINKIPNSIITVSESGIRTLKDVRKVIEAGCDAILMGTFLLKAKDIKQKVRTIVTGNY
ncbi:indole-3-glycerol-phosphate synthase [bacterium]|nr:indole-3-glycerol-phosphate synthase [bacterium]